MKIKYIKIPMSKEEKDKLQAQGYRLINQKFKPADYVDPDEAKIEKPKKKRKVVKNNAE